MGALKAEELCRRVRASISRAHRVDRHQLRRCTVREPALMHFACSTATRRRTTPCLLPFLFSLSSALSPSEVLLNIDRSHLFPGD